MKKYVTTLAFRTNEIWFKFSLVIRKRT